MEIVLGVLAAWGLIMLVWTLVGAVLLPLRRRDDLRLTLFLRGRGEPDELERWIRGLIWVRESGLIWWDIVIASDGLGEESSSVVSRLAGQHADVFMGTIDEIKDWMDE